MSERGIAVGPYLERDVIEDICNAKGLSPSDIGIVEEVVDEDGLE